MIIVNILILGGTGFGGSALVKRLYKNHTITVLDIIAPKHAYHILDLLENNEISYIWKSTIDMQLKDIKQQDIIVDFAAQADAPMGFSSPIHTAYNNILGIIHVMECIKQHPPERYIYMGSGTTFGPNKILPINEISIQCPSNLYSATKTCAEIIIQSYNQSDEIPFTILRNGVVYGENMRREVVVAKFIINALSSKPMIIEGGKQSRDFNYISNMIDAIEMVINSPLKKVNYEIFNCSSGTETTIEDLARKIINITKSNSKLVYSGYRKGEQNFRQRLDISKAKEIFGYIPNILLDEGLNKTISWFKQNLISTS